MKVNKNVNQWYVTDGTAKIRNHVIDENGIYTSKNGGKAGVYQASVIVPGLGREIVMYIGEGGRDGRCFRDRLTEHLRNWLEKPLWYTGISKKELNSAFSIRIDEKLFSSNGMGDMKKKTQNCL